MLLVCAIILQQTQQSSINKSTARSRHESLCDAADVIYWLCAGPSSQMLLVDQSHVLIRQLLYDPLPDPALPTNSSQVSELAVWLHSVEDLSDSDIIPTYIHRLTAAAGPSG